MTVKSVSPKKVADQVFKNEPIYVLDVRSKEESEDWKIEGDHVQLINIPFK
ncbi:hypothetical protein [Planococcus halotolerans]|nr:hypothetical protein [Planococcus halotolerans]